MPLKGEVCLKIPVYNPAVSYIMHHYFFLLLEDLVNDAIVPGPNPVKILCTADFYTVPGEWFFGKRFNFFEDMGNEFTEGFSLNLFQLPF